MRNAARFQQGMSWLEFAVTAVLLGILMLVLVQRLGEYQAAAERAEMEYGVTMIKSALKIRLSVLMVEGRMQETAGLLCENPVRWLEKLPPDYYGEAQGATVARVPPGKWYFDTRECTMVYMVKHGDRFSPDSAGIKRVRYRIKAFASGAAGHPVGLVFELVEPYRWP